MYFVCAALWGFALFLAVYFCAIQPACRRRARAAFYARSEHERKHRCLGEEAATLLLWLAKLQRENDPRVPRVQQMVAHLESQVTDQRAYELGLRRGTEKQRGNHPHLFLPRELMAVASERTK